MFKSITFDLILQHPIIIKEILGYIVNKYK